METNLERYLHLLVETLLDSIYDFPPERFDGRDWPKRAFTMIGVRRLTHLKMLCENAINENVPGDFCETGVWRGGACILMRGILQARSVYDRKVWVCDSFQGLPRPDASKYPADKGDMYYAYHELAVSLVQVKSNFHKLGLLDDQVQFLQGWFKDTLPTAPIEKLSILRLDGDMYESTMDALINLYPKLSVGGYCIIDDYGAVPGCRKAVDDYRAQYGITEEIKWIDWTGVFWKREIL